MIARDKVKASYTFKMRLQYVIPFLGLRSSDFVQCTRIVLTSTTLQPIWRFHVRPLRHELE